MHMLDDGKTVIQVKNLSLFASFNATMYLHILVFSSGPAIFGMEGSCRVVRGVAFSLYNTYIGEEATPSFGVYD